MNFGEQIQIVLNKMIVPHYEDLEGVTYKKYGSEELFYAITFVIKNESYTMSPLTKMEIIHKTQNIVSMIGTQPHEDYAIYFGYNNREYNMEMVKEDLRAISLNYSESYL